MIDRQKTLIRFLDKEQRLKVWPSKPDKKQLAVSFLAEKFEYDKEYSEMEVNQIINSSHSFKNHQLLRRELCDRGFLSRTPNGAKYWREK
jgi:hypothetical protein